MERTKVSNEDRHFLETVKELVKIESVCDFTNPEYPYGEGTERALSYTLNLCESLGFRTKRCSGKTAWAEIGEGSPLIGILGHLDIVPLGEGWTKAQGEECDGKIYGRGVSDDKGPTLAAIFAMKRLLDEGDFKGRIRVIFGQAEETGEWPDLDYYVANEELPDFGFTPDADFPVIYAEKAICCYRLSAPKGSSLLEASAGTASNVVPAQASCTVCRKDGSILSFKSTGKPAHAAEPEKGKNAITGLMEQLLAAEQNEKIDVPFARFYMETFGHTLHGEAMDLPLCDDVSGPLTINAGILKTTKDEICLEIDCRVPVTADREQLTLRLKQCAEPYGITVTPGHYAIPVYTDPNSDLIQSMVRIYREVSGDTTTAPMAIGGGTYAKAMKHVVAFGPLRPCRESTGHQADEYMFIEDLLMAKEIYYRFLKESTR